MRERLTRIRGGVALGVTLVGQRLRRTAPRRVVYSVLGVALAVGLFVLVASVGVGLTAQGSVVDSDADYWIVPESESSATLPVSVGGPQLGSVHGVADRLSDRDDVRYASPVAVSLTEVARANATEYVLVIGVIAHSDLTVGGVHAGPLTPGDPHYAGGTYDGPRTNEVVISEATSALLGAESGDDLTVPTRSGSARLTVVNVSATGSAGIEGVPVAVVHLSELQSITGGADRDTADQLLVSTDSVRLREDLEGVYSHTDVVTRSPGASAGTDGDLALAVGGAGLVVSLLIGSLFVATTMGLEIHHDRRLWATLAAVGFSARSRGLILLVQTGLVTLVGAVIGVGLGLVGVAATNAVIESYFAEATIAMFRPAVGVAGLLVAVGIVGITGPYLLWLTSRGSVRNGLMG